MQDVSPGSLCGCTALFGGCEQTTSACTRQSNDCRSVSLCVLRALLRAAPQLETRCLLLQEGYTLELCCRSKTPACPSKVQEGDALDLCYAGRRHSACPAANGSTRHSTPCWPPHAGSWAGRPRPSCCCSQTSSQRHAGTSAAAGYTHTAHTAHTCTAGYQPVLTISLPERVVPYWATHTPVGPHRLKANTFLRPTLLTRAAVWRVQQF